MTSIQLTQSVMKFPNQTKQRRSQHNANTKPPSSQQRAASMQRNLISALRNHVLMKLSTRLHSPTALRTWRGLTVASRGLLWSRDVLSLLGSYAGRVGVSAGSIYQVGGASNGGTLHAHGRGCDRNVRLRGSGLPNGLCGTVTAVTRLTPAWPPIAIFIWREGSRSARYGGRFSTVA